MNYTAEIKSRLPAREVLEFYGLTVNAAGFCKSPFATNDKTPSLKVYDGDRGWYDYSSNRGGDVIDFVRQFFGASFPDAMKKLNDDFRLGLPIGRELSPAEQARIAAEARQQRAEAQERERQTQALRDAVDRALTAFVLADKVADQIKTGQALAQRDAAWYNYQQAESNLSAFLANSRKGVNA